jgi:hypothetical protein
MYVCTHARTHTHAHTHTHTHTHTQEDLTVMEMKVGGTCMLFGLVEVRHYVCLHVKFVYVSPLISHSLILNVNSIASAGCIGHGLDYKTLKSIY